MAILQPRVKKKFQKFLCYTNIAYLHKMKKLDTNTLFDIFSQGDETIYREHGVEDELNNSFVLLGMVVKGVENYFIIDQIYHTRFGQQYSSVKDSIKLKYFNGLVQYLSRIDISRLDTLANLQQEFDAQAIKFAFEELLEFYEQLEQYEQCAIIYKFYNILEIQ